MSAFIVSHEHIHTIIDGLVTCGLITAEDADPVGSRLWCENHKSVNFRYNTNDEPPAFLYSPRKVRVFDPVKVAKSVHCYEYQSCEHPDWKQSEFCALMRLLTSALWTKVPGYSVAPWGN